jgi:hypothetical protein
MPRFHWPYLILTTAYCAGIFFLSSQPKLPEMPPPWFRFDGMDKVAHTLVYGGLAAVVSVGLWRSDPTIARGRHFVLPIAFALVYGLTDEFHQTFVPNRGFEWLDLFADGIGATIVQGAGCPILWRIAAKSGASDETFSPNAGMDTSKGVEPTE